MRSWVALDILVDVDATEAIESALNQLDSLGTEIDIVNTIKGEPQIVTGFFDGWLDQAEVRGVVDESLRIYGFAPNSVKSIKSRMVEETDWLAEWKRYWKPTGVGRFVIAPPWEPVDETDGVAIYIEPNMAFGTGTHETTQLCLQAIGDNYRAGQTFLDVGTGTGILAIAAAKMFDGVTVAAFETDADAVAIAKDNAIRNGVGGQIEFIEGPIGDDTPVFDFVCANLTIDVIVPILPLLLTKARDKLVISGILVEQKDIIAGELQKFEISNLKFETAGEWISVLISTG